MKYIQILPVLIVACSSAASSQDTRRDQIEACQRAIRQQEPRAQFLDVTLNPGRYVRGENNAFEPIETFPFAVAGEGVLGAYCAYDEAGRLAAADIEEY